MAMKTLLPVDRSRNTKPAEAFALKLHQKTPLDITLLTVINENILHDRGIGPDLMEKLSQSQRQHAAGVLEEVAAGFRRAGVQVSLRIEYGLPGPTICRVAEDEGFEMVMITESKASALGELFLGSVVSHVTHRCRVPVVVLKHEAA